MRRDSGDQMSGLHTIPGSTTIVHNSPYSQLRLEIELSLTGHEGSSERSGVASGLAAKRTPLSPQKSLLAWVSGRQLLLCPCCFIISQQMGTITHFYHCKNNICPTDCIRVVKPCLITCPQRFQLLVATYLSQD